MDNNNEMPKVSEELLDEWAMKPESAVALHLKQQLLPVEADGSGQYVIFPPTYADIGYNIDKLSNGESVALIDSVGSQANRMEPLFKKGGPLASFVPQFEITIGNGKKVSIFDLAHRAADATIQLTPDLSTKVSDAFKELQIGNAAPLCSIAPTSLVFGVWDSRGGTREKRPRLVRSIIRAWNVETLHAAAQFNSVWKEFDEDQRVELEKEAKAKKVELSKIGLKDAPSVFRKTKTPQYINGSPNPEARVQGGVLVRGRIERQLTINLVALRGLHSGNDKEKTEHLRRYLLGLSLLVATTITDLFLRDILR